MTFRSRASSDKIKTSPFAEELPQTLGNFVLQENVTFSSAITKVSEESVVQKIWHTPMGTFATNVSEGLCEDRVSSEIYEMSKPAKSSA
jgi:hypothetical protein